MASPILIWQPGGGVSGGPIPIASVYSQADTTALIEGQAYIDVVFGSIQTDDTWVLVACEVVNEIDPDPLNIWPGIITDRSVSGFRIQLNGMPDSGNYYLSWAVSGINIVPSAASTYFLSGPSSSVFGVDAVFTVSLPPSTTVAGTMTVTPDDGGAGGSFAPTSATLTTSSRTATFTYTAVSYGAKTISVTNNLGLLDPRLLAFTSIAPTYSLSGPSGGNVGVASTDFTVALSGAAAGTVTVTPSSGGGGGTFTPTTVNLTTGAPSATFTYTPASAGAKTISVTNSGGLTNPTSLTYTATTPAIADGDPVSSWPDSSVNANHATMTGSNRPTYKTAIVNGKPVVRFTIAGASKLNLTTPISGAAPWTVYAVMKPTTAADTIMSLMGNDATFPGDPGMIWNGGAGLFFVIDKNQYAYCAVPSFAWHLYTGVTFSAGGTDPSIFYDNNFQGVTRAAQVNTGSFAFIGYNNTPTYCNGDIAEILIYNVGVTGADHNNICAYLGAKYGITVAGGGSIIDPSTVTGLKGWWKADAIV